MRSDGGLENAGGISLAVERLLCQAPGHSQTNQSNELASQVKIVKIVKTFVLLILRRQTLVT